MVPPSLVAATLMAGLVAFREGLAWLRRYEQRRSEGPTTRRDWWFGYLRDAVNVAGVGCAWGVLCGLGGYAGPSGLVAAAGGGVVVYLADAVLGYHLRWRHAWAPLLILSAVASMGLAFEGPSIDAAATRLLLRVAGAP